MSDTTPPPSRRRGAPPRPEPRTRAEARAQREAARKEAASRARAQRRWARREARRVSEFPTIDDSALVTADGQYVTRRTLAQMRRDARERIGPTYVLRELGVVVVLALILSFAIKTWLVQPFFIPSGSMESTLQVGDRVLVSKLTPGPFSLHRGDIVVFEDPDHWLRDSPEVRRSRAGNVAHDALVFVGLAPDDADDHLIKRVIGLPGDTVRCCTVEGKVTVNGTPVEEPYVHAGDVPSIEPFDITVPAGRVWVMGDHRSDSSDSRFHPLGGDGSQGSVPASKVVGRAFAVAWPLDRAGVLGRPGSVFAQVPEPR